MAKPSVDETSAAAGGRMAAGDRGEDLPATLASEPLEHGTAADPFRDQTLAKYSALPTK